MKIHIFNPENDMALASGSPGYTPPSNIRTYRQDNWQLPRLWADEGDVVWDGTSSLASFFNQDKEVPHICPWGWSPALVHQLELAGVPHHLLPSKEYLLKLRTLSSRESTVPIQQSLGIDVAICHNLAQIEQCISRWDMVIMKSPWSSSGKGLMRTDNPNWQGWAQRILRLQGSVIVEKLVSKKLDFAMEFWTQDSKTVFLGLNVFHTDSHGHFISNISGDQEHNASIITSALDNPDEISHFQQWFLDKLPQMAPWYDGPVGVDMLVTTDGTIHPCIEINWRMTMGMAGILKNRQK